MKYGYARVSTDDHNPALQLAALQQAGCTRVLTDEGLSGATPQRPALTRCLTTLRPGDTLMVWTLDRLGRSLRALIPLLDALRAQGITCRALTEHIDTETAPGRAMWQMIGVLADLERSLMTERTRAGGTATRQRGVPCGPTPQLTAQQIPHARARRAQGAPVSVIATLCKVHRATISRVLAAEDVFPCPGLPWTSSCAGCRGACIPRKTGGGSVRKAAHPLEQGWPGHGTPYGARDPRWRNPCRDGQHPMVTGSGRTTARTVAAASQACIASTSPRAHASCLGASPCWGQ